MLFFFGLKSISECNQAFAEFSSKYIEFIDYSILNFDKIVSSIEPEVTEYNTKLKICESLRQKYNKSYLKNMNAIKRKYGDAEVNRLRKKLIE